MKPRALNDAAWRKSTYSKGGNPNDCVEVADHLPGTVPVRDSKHPGGPVILFGDSAWSNFVSRVAAADGVSA
ncbi:DUF397 domain-containing protein [Streptomyces gamaensis]|uniref:DUF397 domain-containing protein n=1 Tax=Streptomyces gamaensis TaxID=1763542 RepID=A0ABW0Z513_9ACTN